MGGGISLPAPRAQGFSSLTALCQSMVTPPTGRLDGAVGRALLLLIGISVYLVDYVVSHLAVRRLRAHVCGSAGYVECREAPRGTGL